MSILLVKKKLSSLVYPSFTANKTTHNPPSNHHLLQWCRSLCSSAPATKTPDPKSHFVADYLITSCGFSPDKAERISKHLNHLKSPEKPDSVLRFLKHQGFCEVQIETLITWHPSLLCANPEKTLEPNLRALRDLGLSSSALTQLLLSNPGALQLSPAVSRIKFWRDFLGGDDEALIRAFKQNKGLIGHDIGRGITPKISLLQKHGFSTCEIRRMVLTIPRFITSSIGLMETLLKRAKEWGFQPETRMFVPGLHAVSCVSEEMLQKKMEFLKSFGWSEEEFFFALRKAPSMVMISVNNLKGKMDFFVGEAGCDPSYCATHPGMLALSLEKRLRPRYHVLRILESKGLASKKRGLFYCFNLSEEKFLERYVAPQKEQIPELHEAYLAACAGRIPTS